MKKIVLALSLLAATEPSPIQARNTNSQVKRANKNIRKKIISNKKTISRRRSPRKMASKRTSGSASKKNVSRGEKALVPHIFNPTEIQALQGKAKNPKQLLEDVGAAFTIYTDNTPNSNFANFLETEYKDPIQAAAIILQAAGQIIEAEKNLDTANIGKSNAADAKDSPLESKPEMPKQLTQIALELEKMSSVLVQPLDQTKLNEVKAFNKKQADATKQPQERMEAELESLKEAGKKVENTAQEKTSKTDRATIKAAEQALLAGVKKTSSPGSSGGGGGGLGGSGQRLNPQESNEPPARDVPAPALAPAPAQVAEQARIAREVAPAPAQVEESYAKLLRFDIERNPEKLVEHVCKNFINSVGDPFNPHLLTDIIDHLQATYPLNFEEALRKTAQACQNTAANLNTVIENFQKQLDGKINIQASKQTILALFFNKSFVANNIIGTGLLTAAVTHDNRTILNILNDNYVSNLNIFSQNVTQLEYGIAFSQFGNILVNQSGLRDIFFDQFQENLPIQSIIIGKNAVEKQKISTLKHEIKNSYDAISRLGTEFAAGRIDAAQAADDYAEAFQKRASALEKLAKRYSFNKMEHDLNNDPAL